MFGNSLLTKKRAAYVEAKGRELIDLLTNDAGTLKGLVDLSLLKFKERDELENIFKTWRESVAFDIAGLRDERCRGYYETR